MRVSSLKNPPKENRDHEKEKVSFRFNSLSRFFVLVANISWILFIISCAVILKSNDSDLFMFSAGEAIVFVFPALIALFMAIYTKSWSANLVSLLWLIIGLAASMIIGFYHIVTLAIFMMVPVSALGFGKVQTSVEVTIFAIITFSSLSLLVVFSPLSDLFSTNTSFPTASNIDIIFILFFIVFASFFLFNILALKEVQILNWIRQDKLFQPVFEKNRISKRNPLKKTDHFLEEAGKIIFDREGKISQIKPKTLDFFIKSIAFVYGSDPKGKKVRELYHVLRKKNDQITGTEEEVLIFITNLMQQYFSGFEQFQNDIQTSDFENFQGREYNFTIKEQKALQIKAFLKIYSNQEYLLFLTHEKDVLRLMKERDQALLDAQSKTEYLANMSHELRTPLNAIIGFSEIMKTRLFGPIPDQYSDYIDMTYTSGRHLLDLIGDVLDLSKIEANKYILNYELFDIKILVESCTGMLRSSAKDKKIKLINKYQGKSIEISADRTACRQIILNLLSNAIKYTEENGEVRINLEDKGNNKVVINIWDTGIGLSQEEIKRIGSPYEQAKNRSNNDVRSSGLGLSLVKQLVMMHKGEFMIDSELGKGTHIALILPVMKPKKAK